MPQLLKVQLEDEDGNIYYLHTSGDSVFLDDGRTVQAAIEQTVRQSAISNVQVNDSSKVPSAALAYAMQQQITWNEDAIRVLNSDIENKLFGNLFPWFPNGESLDNMIQISSSGYFHNAGIYIYGTKEGNCPAEGLPLNVYQYGTLVIFAGNGDGGYGYGFALYVTTHEDNPFLSVYTRQSGWGKIITDNNF